MWQESRPQQQLDYISIIILTIIRILKELKTKALDTVKECGSPESLALALNKVSNKIGLSWEQDLKALPSVN